MQGSSTGAPGQDAFQPCPGGGEPCKILPLGDSITVGLGDGRPSGGFFGQSESAGYRIELFSKAQDAGHNITFVGGNVSGPDETAASVPFPKNHQARSGATIQDIAAFIPRPGLVSKPHIVLVMAGTNDMYVTKDGPVAEAPERLGGLIDKIIAADPNIYIVVAQITPLAGRFAFSDPSARSFNAALPAIVEERVGRGAHVFLVDMHTGFPSGGLEDGVHPNPQGYEWMAGVWYDAIEQWLR